MNTPSIPEATAVFENVRDSTGIESLAPLESDRPIATDNLEESEVSYRFLFEANPNPMWIADCETLRFLLVNEAAIEHFGYSKDEFLAMTIMDIRPAEDVPILSEVLEKAKLSGVPTKGKRGIWRYKKKDGQIVDVEITVNGLQFRGRAARLIMVNDVTERRQTEQTLHHIMEGAHCLLWQAEVEEDAEKQMLWKLHFASEQAVQRFLPLHVPAGQSYSDAWYKSRPLEERKQTDLYGEGEIRAGRSYQQEFRCQNSAGAFKWLSENVRVEVLGEGKWRCTGVCTDITERKLAEEATHAMTRGAQCLLWYAFVEEQPHGLEWYTEIPDEETAKQFFPVKQSPEQSYAVALAQSRLPEDGVVMNARGTEALRSGKQGFTQQFRCLRADGEWRWLNETVRVEALTPGRWHCVGVCVDITEQKRAEEELKEAEIALRRAYEELETRVVERTTQIMEVNAQLLTAKQEAERANHAKSEFLSRMSHELRTPLNAILGFGQILDREALTLLQQESVQYILTGGRHLLGLINEVLDLARVEAGHIELSLEPISLAEIVSESCALVRPLAAERKISLDANTAALGRSHVRADRQRLKQALINLLSNAIKYNRPEGQVRVYSVLRPDNRLAIAVQDTGPGISVEDQKRLFLPFERLSAGFSEVEGTGLGLAMAQRLVVAMGGSLTLESLPGEGTTFFIELPQVPSPLESLSEHPVVGGCEPHAGSSKERKATILTIEDNLSNMRLLEVLLRSRPGTTLLTAMQGSIGLEMARQHMPDLILLDLNLPDISGKEVLARLQASALTRDIPVVILSADATATQIERLRSAGARAYLTKPLDVAEFLYTLETLLPTREAASKPGQEFNI